MNVMVINILALGLTLSQLFTRPIEQFKTQFNPQTDLAEIQQIMHDGCLFFPKQMSDEEIDIDFLVDMGISALKAEKLKASAEAKLPVDPSKPAVRKTFFRKLAEQVDADTMMAAYRQLCKNEKIENSPFKIDDVIAYYNKNMANLPDEKTLKGLRLKGSSLILDRNGDRFTEVYADNNRRRWIGLNEIPKFVRQAFIAAEDQRFRDHDFKNDKGEMEHIAGHHGVDPVGVLRAVKDSLISKNRPQGGSTITQQVVKNLLVGDDVNFDRKIREMVVATRLEKVLSKDEILELYLNQVFLGRASWGVEMAAQSYFGKSVRDIDLGEAALLASLTRGPTAYDPDVHPDKMQERRAYVLNRMHEDHYITKPEFDRGVNEKVATIDFEPLHTRAAFYFLDEVQRDAKKVAKLQSLTADSYTVRSTLHPELQKVTEAALREGLMTYEAGAGRTPPFQTEGNLAADMEKYQTTWEDVLPKVHGRLYDVPWHLATVLDTGGTRVVVGKKGKRRTVASGFTVGLADGTTAILQNASPAVLRRLKPYDLVYVTVDESGAQSLATLQTPPRVQGAVVVLEAKTGRVLAMTGGFSYGMSQLNRATRTARQPGSTLKPFIYLSALQIGFQPNTLIPNELVTLPPISRGGKYWSPQNYNKDSGGLVTIRRAVEQSMNLPTVRLMSEMGQDPTEGLDYIAENTQKLGIYEKPIRFYPFVLGAQPARLIDMAVAYATIANIGLKPTAHFIDSIELDGKSVYDRDRMALEPIPGIDRVSFYQIRHILEGTIERGTAVKMKDLAGYVGGKTGTSNNENDAWFIGFTNDLVVATWVGYDNRNIEASLGAKNTGAAVALPIGEKVIRASFGIYKEKELLSGPPREILSQITQIPIDPYTGQFRAGDYPEVFRLESTGQAKNTQHSLLTGAERSMPLAEAPAGDDGRGGEDWDYQDQTPETMDPGYDQPFVPGAENMNELWRRRGRQVDSLFN